MTGTSDSETGQVQQPASSAPPAPQPAVDRSHRSASIDALRAVAALAVVGYHTQFLPRTGPASGFAHAVMYNLDAGVQLFFVISGLLIAGPFVERLVEGRPETDLRAYAVRRAARILPAYWLALLLSAIAGVSAAWWQWGVHIVLFQEPIPHQIDAILTPAWTLHVELVFYLLVPLGCLLLRRRRQGAVPLGTVAGAILAVWAASTLFEAASASIHGRTLYGLATHSVPATLGLFCPGILVALARTRAARSAGGAWAAWRRFMARPLPVAVVAGVLVLLALRVSVSSSLVVVEMRRPLFAVAGGLLLALVLEAGPQLHRVLRPLAPLGVISYSIYLVHTIVRRELLDHGVLPGSGWSVLPARAALIGAVSVAVAALMYLLVERPAMRWAAGRTRRRTVVEVPATLAAVPAAAE
jgi:peptidoglycan/LPS O-acetylase OafA/YrhL